jgi:hypothetical protein
MSIKTTTTIEVTPDTTEITPSVTKDLVGTNTHCVEIEDNPTITGIKKEYSIVGDGLYASIEADEAPPWLVSIIDTVVENSTRERFENYTELVEDVRGAVDSIDIAKNTFVKKVNFSTDVEGVVGSNFQSLNATLGAVSSTIVDIDTVRATASEAVTVRVSDLRAEFDNNESRFTNITSGYTSADTALGQRIDVLTGKVTSQDGELAGTSDAIDGLRTYVGLTDFNDPNGTGMLARVQVLENQNDGVIEYTTGTYDVMTGVSPGDSNLDDDELDVAAEPYATWIATDTTNSDEAERSAHVGDVYIQYDASTGNYVKSYKFIKTAQDTTSPFATDPQGYTWALVTDTDSQSAYVAALNAADLADQKRRVFVAVPFAPYDKGDLWVDNSTSPSVVKVATIARANTYNAGDWAVADEQAQYFIDNTYTPDSAAIHRQLDGKIEYYFYDTFADVLDVSEVAAINEADALDIIDNTWSTPELKDAANGNIVYFKDTTNAYWYQASTPAWLTVTDTSMYQALQDAATAQGAADGKVSQFYAWGGTAAPADYDVVVEPAYTDEDNNEVAAVTTTVSADNFLYWYKTDGILYYKPLTEWTAVPITAGTGNVYVAEGDIVTVFDPTDGDISNYSYNGTTWQRTGPTGIISQSSYFLDLDTAVRGPNGVAQGLVDLRIDSEAYTNDEVTGVVNSFKYDSVIYLNGAYYKSGFGMNTVGVAQNETNPPTGESEDSAFDSEFYVNAERFVLKSPSYPDVEAVFKVTNTGISLGLEHTEATRNRPRGSYAALVEYFEGDIVTFNNSSYVALVTVTGVTPGSDDTKWQLLAAQGTSPLLYEFEGTDTWPVNTTSASADEHTFTSSFAGNTIIRVLAYDAEGGVRLSLNDGSAIPFSRSLADNTEEWYEFSFDNLIAGDNSIKIWSTSDDGGSIKKIEVAFSGASGLSGGTTDFLFIRSVGVPTDPPANEDWETNAVDATGEGDLWSIKKVTNAGEVIATYTDKRIIEAPMIRELTIYSDPTTGAVTAPTTSTYNLSTDTLTIDSDDWNKFVPGITTNNHKIYVSTALVTGNNTQTSVDISWSEPAVYAFRQDGIDADVYKYVYKDNLTKPSAPTDDAHTGWVDDIPSTINNTLWQSLGKQTNGTGTYLWAEPVQITAKDGLSALLFEWAGSVSWPTSTGIGGAHTFTFDSAFAGNAFLRVNATDAEGGLQVALNGEVLGSLSGNNNQVRWYEFGADNLVTGTNTIALWSSTGDGGSINEVKVAFVGAKGIQGITGDFTDFLFIRKDDVPQDPGGADGNWYTDVNSVVVPEGGGKLWSIKKKTTNNGSTVEYSDKRVIEADIVREVVLYSAAVDSAPAVPTTEVTYNFSTNTITENHTSWSTSFPSDVPDNKKVYRITALASGNITETSVSLEGKWSTPSVYAQRIDGTNGSSAYQLWIAADNTGTEAEFLASLEASEQHFHIRYSNAADGTDFNDVPGDKVYVGIYVGSSATAPTLKEDYAWSRARGEDGDTPIKGTDYNDGVGSYVSYVFLTHTAAPGVPTGGSYTGTAETMPTTVVSETTRTWSDDPIVASGSTTWVSKRVYTQTLSDGSASTTWTGSAWSTPSKFFEKGSTGTPADNYKEIFLYETATAAPTALPTKLQGFTASSGNAAASGNWTVSSTPPTAADQKIYRINITMRQVDNDGDWSAIDDNWNGPVAITGIDGNSATSYKEIFLYKNATSTPTVPGVSGSFSTSGNAVSTDGWYVSPQTLTSGEFTWRSSLTVKQANSTGNWTNSDSSWNTPVKLTGDKGTSIKGDRGTAVLTHSADLGDVAPAADTTLDLIAGYWGTASSADYTDEITGDTLILTNTDTAAGWTHIYQYTTSGWGSGNNFIINGNQIVNGSVVVTGNQVVGGELDAGLLKTGYIQTKDLDNVGDPLQVISPTYSGTIIDEKGVRVYNNGVLRVKIGNLSPDS